MFECAVAEIEMGCRSIDLNIIAVIVFGGFFTWLFFPKNLSRHNLSNEMIK